MKAIKTLITNTYNSQIGFLSSIALTTSIGTFAVIFIQLFGLTPCALCKIQEHIVLIISIISSAGIFFHIAFQKETIINTATKITNTTIFASHLFSWYQLGVEKKLFPLPSFCKQEHLNVTDLNKLEMLLSSTTSIRCDQTQIIGGITIAEWTVIGTGAMALWTLGYIIYQRNNRAKNNRIKN